MLPKMFRRLQTMPVAPGEAEPLHHYQPTQEYHPTLIPAKCSHCSRLGLVEFQGGFNLKDGDKLMDGRVIRGRCGYCMKMADLVPIKVPQNMRKELWLQAAIEDAIRGHLDRGHELAGGFVVPKGRAEAYDKWRRENPQSVWRPAEPGPPYSETAMDEPGPSKPTSGWRPDGT